MTDLTAVGQCQCQSGSPCILNANANAARLLLYSTLSRGDRDARTRLHPLHVAGGGPRPARMQPQQGRPRNYANVLPQGFGTPTLSAELPTAQILSFRQVRHLLRRLLLPLPTDVELNSGHPHRTVTTARTEFPCSTAVAWASRTAND